MGKQANIRKKRENLLANLRKLVQITENRPPSPASLSNSPSPLENDVFFPKENNDIEMGTISTSKKSSSKKGKKKNKESFEKLISKQLMLSEWLVDVPEDFYENWFMVSCPNGRRCIVIATKGETKVYSRNGRLMTRFQSHLPGGSKKTIQKSSRSTILDCIYVEQNHRFWILDVISWNGCTFFDCDTEFRFYWLRMKFEEEVKLEQQKTLESLHSKMDLDITNDSNLNLSSSSSSNIFETSVSQLYSFEPLQYSDCNVENVIKILDSDKETQSQVCFPLFFFHF